MRHRNCGQGESGSVQCQASDRLSKAEYRSIRTVRGASKKFSGTVQNE